MGGPRPVKNGRGPVDRPASDLALIHVAPEYEYRQHRPIVRVLRHPSVAEIDDSTDDDAAGLVQYVHLVMIELRSAGPFASLPLPRRGEVAGTSIPALTAHLETVQYGACARPYKGSR